MAAETPTAAGAIPQLTLSLRDHEHVPNGSGASTGKHSAKAKQQEAWSLIKDGLALPMKTALCRAAGLALPPSLLLLPSELRDRCLQLLEVKTAHCCHTMPSSIGCVDQMLATGPSNIHHEICMKTQCCMPC